MSVYTSQIGAYEKKVNNLANTKNNSKPQQGVIMVAINMRDRPKTVLEMR